MFGRIRIILALVIPSLMWIGKTLAAPDSDNFVNRTVLAGRDVVFRTYLLDAGIEPGEPNHAAEPDQSSRSIWASWTAPDDGIVDLGDGSSVPSAVYIGDSLPALSLVARWQPGINRVPLISVRRGDVLQIAVFSWSNVDTVPGTLRLRFYPPPQNDNFASRSPLEGARPLLASYWIGATLETNEPIHAEWRPNASLWWKWTPPISGLLAASSRFGPAGQLFVYKGSVLTNLTPLGSISPGSGTVPVRAGEPLQLAMVGNVAGFEAPFEAQLTLSDMRIASPASGSSVAIAGPLSLRLENVPPDVTSLVVYSENENWTFYTNLVELVVPHIAPGIRRLRVLGLTAEGHNYHTPEVTVTVQAGSDSFAAAPRIPEDIFEIGGDMATATVEPGEPPPFFPASPQSGTVWWRWSAPVAGRVMTTIGWDVDFFIGTGLSNLQSVPYLGDLGMPSSGWPNMVTYFYPEPGRNYWARVRKIGVPPYGWSSSLFVFQPRSTNDSFAQPMRLSSLALDLELPRDYATFEENEPGPTGIETGSRWFTYTASGDGFLDVAITGAWTATDRMSLMVFTGDSLSNLFSTAEPSLNQRVPVREGFTYHIRLQLPNDLPEALRPRLSLNLNLIPVNDNLADAFTIPADEGILTGSNDNATKEPGEMIPGPFDMSVWYRFTAPHDGALVITARPSEESVNWHAVQTGFASGDSIGTLSWVDGQVRDGQRAAVELSAGQQVLLAVWNTIYDGSHPTAFVLEHRFVARPPNDLFASRELLEGTRIETRGTNWLATAEPGDPRVGSLNPSRTVWWTWTAPATGFLDVRNPVNLLALFTGDSPSSLRRVWPADTTNNALGGMRFPVVAGTNYQILVDRNDSSGQLGAFTMNGLAGFGLSLRLESVELATPENLSVFTEGHPVEFALRPVDPTLDGTISSVTYLQATNVSSTVRTRSLGTVGRSPHSLTLTNLPPGLHQVQAVVTNQTGEVLYSPVVAVRVVPANDNFGDAREISGFRFTNIVTWSGATYEPGEPAGATAAQGTVWLRWQAPATGTLRVASSAPGFSLFTGSRLTNLVAVSRTGFGSESFYSVTAGAHYYARIAAPVAGFRLGAVQSAAVRFDLIVASLTSPPDNAFYAAGQNVPLRLDLSDSSIGLDGVDFEINGNRLTTISGPPWAFTWTNPPPGRYTVTARTVRISGESIDVAPATFVVRPANNGFADATPLNEASGQLRATTIGSSPDIAGNSAGDIWFIWTAPADGLFFVNPPAFGGTVDLFTGTNVANLSLQTNRLAVFTPASRGEWLVHSNTTYRLVIYEPWSPSGSEFDLRWDFQTRATNDNFADRVQLEGAAGEAAANHILATAEDGEPDYGFGNVPASSVWWTWTAPRDGILELTSPDESLASLYMWLFTGPAGSLARVAEFGDMPFSPPYARYFRVSGGVPVHLASVRTFDNVRDLRWSWRLMDPPANDQFAGRIALDGTRVSVPGTTFGATAEPGDAALVLSEDEIYSVWWSWTAPADGDLIVKLLDLQESHRMVICRGERPGPLEVLKALYHTPAYPDLNPLQVQAGDRLQIMASGNRPGEDFRLELDLRTRPANDDFAQRRRIEGARVHLSDANWRSTREFGEPIHSDRFGGRSVWYAWRAPANGDITVQTDQPFMALAAYEGDSLSTLREVARAEQEWAPLRFAVEAGRDYAIAVDGASGFTSEFNLDLRFYDELPIPSVEIGSLPDGYMRVSARDLSPGLWILEGSFDLKTWTKFSDVPRGDEFTYDYPSFNIPVVYFRLRRLD